MASKTTRSFFAILITTLIGISVAALAGQNGAMIGPVSLFLLCGILCFAVNWLSFVPANIFKTEKYYDLIGSVTYLSVIALAASLAQTLDTRALLVIAMVVIWTVRLGVFLFKRIEAQGHDRRFDAIKTSASRFFLTWTLQGLWVLLTSACALAVIISDIHKPLGTFAYIGIGMWVIGFAIEVVADNQKLAFRQDPANKERFISTGLWAWSRHPNYFGEILLWLGVAIVALPVLTGWQWVVLISPVFVTLLLTRVSGIPLLEAHGKKKWGEDSAYQAYIAKTPALIPMFPK